MTKFIVVALLLVAALAFDFSAGTECLQTVRQVSEVFSKITEIQNPNKKIDAFVGFLSSLPESIDICLGKRAANAYKNQLPPVCIQDLGKAAKIGVRLMNETENQLLFTKDMVLLQRLFQTKLKKECPILSQVRLQEIKDTAACAEASYRFSLQVQKLLGDLEKSDRSASLYDINQILNKLPGTLDSCGQTQYADLVRTYLSMDCVHAVEDFVGYLSVVEHNYAHLDWLVKNYKNIEVYFKMMQVKCPALQMI